MGKLINTEQRRKVVIVGAGAVGATFCYALAQSGLADEIVLTDQNEDRLQGQVMDLVHGQPFFPTVIIRRGSSADFTDAHIVVITAGASQRPGETRLELLRKNADIIGDIAEEISNRKCMGIMLLVSNPVDIMTYVALKRSGWDRNRVLGSGTVLDSSRFRHLLSNYCGIDVHNVHAYILGEHGDSEFAAWSMTHVAGMNINEFCPFCGKCDDWKNQQRIIEKQVRDSAYHIINYKGSTQFAVGLALVNITSAILRSQNSMLTVSTLLEGEFGISDVCLSVPSIVSEAGVIRIINSPLTKEELDSLAGSARVLRTAIGSIQ